MSKTKTKVKTTTAVENRACTVRMQLQAVDTNIEKGYVNLALLAYEAEKNKFYNEWGFKDFEEYAEKELKMRYRKLKHFIKIGKKVTDLNLPKDRLEKLGWSKVSALLGILDPTNIDEWLGKAEKMSVREVIESVKVVKINDPNVTTPKIVKINFKLHEDTASVVLDALEVAKTLTGQDCMALAIEMICSDWMQAQAAVPTKGSLDHKIKYLEQIYGPIKIKVITEKQDDNQTVKEKPKKKVKKDEKAKVSEVPQTKETIKKEITEKKEESQEDVTADDLDLLDDLLIGDEAKEEVREENEQETDEETDDELRELLMGD